MITTLHHRFMNKNIYTEAILITLEACATSDKLQAHTEYVKSQSDWPM